VLDLPTEGQIGDRRRVAKFVGTRGNRRLRGDDCRTSARLPIAGHRWSWSVTATIVLGLIEDTRGLDFPATLRSPD
jgi:hypothetical protein